MPASAAPELIIPILTELPEKMIHSSLRDTSGNCAAKI
jgi:hypothetical protein